MRWFICLSLVAVILCAGCTPKIYVVDRQSVLEDEAAGRWPDFEKELIEKAKARGPTAFAKTPMNARRARLYNVLNGHLPSTTKN